MFYSGIYSSWKKEYFKQSILAWYFKSILNLVAEIDDDIS